MSETNIYRVNPTGYFGKDSSVAHMLDLVQFEIMRDATRLVQIWANNDGGSYELFWTLDDTLIVSEGIPFDMDQAAIHPRFYAEQILALVEKHKDDVII